MRDMKDDPPAFGGVVPEHVTILGLGRSLAAFLELIKRLGGRSAYCDAVWGINAVGDVLACDLIFHMDDMRVQEARAAARPDGNIAAMVKWLKYSPVPVITSIPRYPGHHAFPLEAVLNGGNDSNGGAPYFNSTAAYAVAYAIHIGVKRISLFGIDYTLPNAHEAEQGRACVEFWLGMAAQMGVEIAIPKTSSLMDAYHTQASRFYGYDTLELDILRGADGLISITRTERATLPTAEEIERNYDHSAPIAEQHVIAGGQA